MKTFQEFVEEIYLIEGRTREEILKGISAGIDRARRIKRRKPIELQAAKYGLAKGKNVTARELSRRSGIMAIMSTSPTKKAQKLRRETIQDLKQHYDESDYEKAQKKRNKLNRTSLEAHHITPLNYSRKLKSTMTPEEWKERVRKDAENGIYHGHHHKNIMGAVADETPESRSKRGIKHKKGGAHELEAKTKDLYTTGISHKSLLAAAHRRHIRKQKEKERRNAT